MGRKKEPEEMGTEPTQEELAATFEDMRGMFLAGCAVIEKRKSREKAEQRAKASEPPAKPLR
jgi:hypothetical protein